MPHINYMTPDNKIYSSYDDGMMNVQPSLKIVVQPASKFRFRYETEKPNSHGMLYGGESSDKLKKQYPTVKVEGYNGPVRVYASLATIDVHKPHVHQLVGKSCKDGVSKINLDCPADRNAVFQNMGILYTARKKVLNILYEQHLKSSNPNEAIDVHQHNAKLRADADFKHLNLNSVCLRFDAEASDPNVIFNPVFSSSISNSKSVQSGVLRIVRMAKNTSVCSGHEEIYLLCEKVNKSDIKVRFFQTEDGTKEGNEIWENYGRFSDFDVHKQYAIVFTTPPFRSENINQPAKVFIQLCRPSDGERSEPRDFTYIPLSNDSVGINSKKRKVNDDYQDGNGTCRNNYIHGRNSTDTTMENSSASDDYPSGVNTVYGSTYLSLFDSAIQHLSDPSSVEQPSGSDSEGSFFNFDCITGFLDPDLVPDSVLFDNSNFVAQGDDTGPSVASSQQPAVKPKHRSKVITSKVMSFIFPHIRIGRYSTTAETNLELLLVRDGGLLSFKDRDGNNAIHRAIMCNFNYAAEIMIKHAAKFHNRKALNYPSRFGFTPLHMAVLTNSPDLVIMLVESNVDCTFIDDNGNSVVHIATMLEHYECVEALLQMNRGQMNKIIGVKNFDGMTALHYAVLLCNIRLVHLLCEHVLDINVQDAKSGKTCVHIAVEVRQSEILKTILESEKTDVNMETFAGHTPLMYAKTNGFSEGIKLLTEYGAKSDGSSLQDISLERTLSSEKDSSSADDCDDATKTSSIDISESEPEEVTSNDSKRLNKSGDDLPQKLSHLNLGKNVEIARSDANDFPSSAENFSESNKKQVILHEDEGYHSKELLTFNLEDKLASLLDCPPNNYWKEIASVFQCDESSLSKNKDGPTKTIINELKQQGRDLMEIPNALDLIDLKEIAEIVKKEILKSSAVSDCDSDRTT